MTIPAFTIKYYDQVKTQITWKEVNVTDYESNTTQARLLGNLLLLYFFANVENNIWIFQ